MYATRLSYTEAKKMKSLTLHNIMSMAVIYTDLLLLQ